LGERIENWLLPTVCPYVIFQNRRKKTTNRAIQIHWNIPITMEITVLIIHCSQ